MSQRNDVVWMTVREREKEREKTITVKPPSEWVKSQTQRDNEKLNYEDINEKGGLLLKKNMGYIDVYTIVVGKCPPMMIVIH